MSKNIAKKKYWVYIILCNNQSYYTGYTDNLEKRYHSHVHGTGGCKYTRSFKPIKMVQCWQVNDDKLLAMRLEREIKKRSRKEKLILIEHPSTLSSDPQVQPSPIPRPIRKIKIDVPVCCAEFN